VQRDLASARSSSFGYAEALLQIAIVLMSVTIIALSRPLMGFSLALGALGTGLMRNGFVLWFRLPF
jgi:hypothetical protein